MPKESGADFFIGQRIIVTFFDVHFMRDSEKEAIIRKINESTVEVLLDVVPPRILTLKKRKCRPLH
jgi:hypothetical protein